jgi:hypothetical protein
MSAASISPFDAPNRRTIAQGHPTNWQPPPTQGRVRVGGDRGRPGRRRSRGILARNADPNPLIQTLAEIAGPKK